MKTLLILLLASFSFGQDIPVAPQENIFELPRFTDGLNTRFSANAISDNSLSEALNVLIDEDQDGVPVRRTGYSKCNASAIGDSKTFRGLYTFDAADGTHYHVGLSSETLYQHDGDCLWADLTPSIAGLSSSAELECVQALGKLWCANGVVVVWWDGTSSGTASAAPLGTLIDTFRNRIVLGDVSGAQSRFRLSGELDGEDWTDNIYSTSPITLSIGGVNDGNKISCLMGAYNDAYIIGKENGIYALYGFDRNDFVLREISREVGCIEQRTVREKNGCLYWLSKRGLERMCGNRIDRVSDPIRNVLDTIIATAGNARSVMDSIATDFNAGNLTASGPGAPMSTTISPGNVVPSTWSITTSINTTDFAMVDIDTTAYVSTHVDNFDDGDYTTGVAWTLRTGTGFSDFYISSGMLTPNGSEENSTIGLNVNRSSGIWSFVVKSTSILTSYNFGFGKTNLDYNNGSYGHTVSFYNTTLYYQTKYSGGDSNLASESIPNIADGSNHTVTISRSGTGFINVLIDGSVVLSTSPSNLSTTTGTYITVALVSSEHKDRNPQSHIGNFKFPSFYELQTSNKYDTGLSTPIWGPYVVDQTTSSLSSSTFRTETSVNGSTSWSGMTSVSPSEKIASASRRYIRHGVIVYPAESSAVQSITGITLSGETTGYFISQCQNPGTSISEWGRFLCDTVPNNGSLTFHISTGSTCHEATRTTSTWNSQTNGAVISLSTKPYVAYRVLFDLDSATETPTLQDCTINWIEGETRPPAASSVYRDRYYLAYSSDTASGAKNDHILVLDKNDKWTLFDDNFCYSLGLYERHLYCGSSTNNGTVYLMDSGSDDAGSGFTSRIRTKAFSFGYPDRRKTFRTLGLELDPESNDSDSISLTARYYVDRGTTSNSLGTIDLGEDSHHLLWANVPFPTDNPVSSRYLQLELEANGTNQPFRLFGGKLKYRYLRED